MSKNPVNCLEHLKSDLLIMATSSQASKEEGSTTIPGMGVEPSGSKRRAPLAGDDIVWAAMKVAEGRRISYFDRNIIDWGFSEVFWRKPVYPRTVMCVANSVNSVNGVIPNTELNMICNGHECVETRWIPTDSTHERGASHVDDDIVRTYGNKNHKMREIKSSLDNNLAFPLVRAIFPELVSASLVSVQPYLQWAV